MGLNISQMEMGVPNVLYYYWLICWKFITPVVLTVLVIGSMVASKPLEYADGVPIDIFMQVFGWMMTFSSVMLIPAFGAWNVYKRYRAGKPLGKALFEPTGKWKPAASASASNAQLV